MLLGCTLNPSPLARNVWYETRHGVADKFLDKFLDVIPYFVANLRARLKMRIQNERADLHPFKVQGCSRFVDP